MDSEPAVAECFKWPNEVVVEMYLPYRTDWLGNSLLHTCAEIGNRPAAAVLLDAGAEIDARDVEFQGTPLAAAVRACCTVDDPQRAPRARRMIEFLLKRGAKANLPGDKPWATPLAWAVKRGHTSIEALLRAAGAVT